jgi:hypothetical protein
LGNPWSKQRFHDDSTGTKIIGKPHRENQLLCVYPLLVLRPDLDSSQDSRKVSQGIFQKNPKIDEVIEGEIFMPFEF